MQLEKSSVLKPWHYQPESITINTEKKSCRSHQSFSCSVQHCVVLCRAPTGALLSSVKEVSSLPFTSGS